MFERRQRATQSLLFTQVQRHLKSNENLPAIPSLAAQLMACQHEMLREKSRRQNVADIEPSDEMQLHFEEDDDLDD